MASFIVENVACKLKAGSSLGAHWYLACTGSFFKLANAVLDFKKVEYKSEYSYYYIEVYGGSDEVGCDCYPDGYIVTNNSESLTTTAILSNIICDMGQTIPSVEVTFDATITREEFCDGGTSVSYTDTTKGDSTRTIDNITVDYLIDNTETRYAIGCGSLCTESADGSYEEDASNSINSADIKFALVKNGEDCQLYVYVVSRFLDYDYYERITKNITIKSEALACTKEYSIPATDTSLKDLKYTEDCKKYNIQSTGEEYITITFT